MAARVCALFFSLLLLSSVSAASSAASQKPRVRAITAFVRVDANHYEAQVHDALTLLHNAARAYQQHGYEVQTLRITTQPFPEIITGLSPEQTSRFFDGLQELAKRESFLPNIGPAGLDGKDVSNATAEFLANVLTSHDQLSASIAVADKDGIHWQTVRAAARVFKLVAERTPHGQGTFGFSATALLGPYAPFFPGSYHDGPGRQFSVGLESANLVQAALAVHPGNLDLTEKDLLQSMTEYSVDCENIAKSVEQQSGWTYAGLDPTPAPGSDASIGAAIESFAQARFGSSGTLSTAAMITRVVKSIPVKQVGYAGLMLPVLEDPVLAKRWSESSFTIDSLLAYSAVCGAGLDTVPLPGDVSEDQLAHIIGDTASLAFKWKKPLSARLQPSPGKTAGQSTDFDNPHLANAVLQKLP
jgi:uncharacterized protein